MCGNTENVQYEKSLSKKKRMNVMANQHNEDPFADYLWMGDMEKFDEEIEAEMEKEFHEQQFIKSCIEQLLDEEEERETVFFPPASNVNGYSNNDNGHFNHSNGLQEVPNGYHNMEQDVNNMYITRPYEKTNVVSVNHYNHQFYNGLNHQQVPQVKKSTLNPNAVPFVMNPNAKSFVPRSYTETSNTTTTTTNVPPNEQYGQSS